ncbi:MAG: hypothetical protein OWQ57_06060 [Sulfobacillus sp.]|nr:hypothetical protein [Sulfobacillus sp.]
MKGYGQRPKAYVTLQVRLTPELKERLAQCAFALEASQTSVVTEALKDFLGRHPLPNMGWVYEQSL